MILDNVSKSTEQIFSPRAPFVCLASNEMMVSSNIILATMYPVIVEAKMDYPWEEFIIFVKSMPPLKNLAGIHMAPSDINPPFVFCITRG